MVVVVVELVANKADRRGVGGAGDALARQRAVWRAWACVYGRVCMGMGMGMCVDVRVMI